MRYERAGVPAAATRIVIGVLMTLGIAVTVVVGAPAPASAAASCGAFGENGTLEATGVSCAKARSVMRYAEAHDDGNAPRGPKGWKCARGYPDAPSMAAGFTCRRGRARVIVRYREQPCLQGAMGDCLVRPKRLFATVSDLDVDRLRWRSWGGKTATATGRYHLRKMGTDQVTTGRATVTASGRKRCGRQLRYSRFTIRMRGRTHRFGPC